MNSKYYFPVLFSLLFALSSCNPECQLVAGLHVTTLAVRAGDEIIVTATPPSSLFDKNVTLNGRSVVGSPHESGLIIKVPDDFGQGIVEVAISDSDCTQKTTFEVRDNGYFSTNPNFIFPSSPQIIFPVTLTPPYPPAINNAWLAAYEPAYCLWFVMQTAPVRDSVGQLVKDSQGNQLYNTLNVIDPQFSFETGTPCSDPDAPYVKLFKNKPANPVSGLIDSVNNIVNIWIDRTANDLGIEELEGQFISIDNVPSIYQDWQPTCDGFDAAIGSDEYKKRCHMMILTSKKTGRQVLVYQQGLKANSTPAAAAAGTTPDEPCQ